MSHLLLGIDNAPSSSEGPRTISIGSDQIYYDQVFTKMQSLFEFVKPLISGGPKLCFSVAGSFDVNKKIVEEICAYLLQMEPQMSVSLVLVSGPATAKDLFGGPTRKPNSVTGISVTSVAQIIQSVSRFAPPTIAAGEVLILTCHQKGASARRINITFSGPGVWQKAFVSKESMLMNVAKNSVCVRINSIRSDQFAKEWRIIFPAATTVQQQPSNIVESVADVAPSVAQEDVASSSSEDDSVLRKRLRDAEAQIKDLQEKLEEAQRRIELRENTLVNILISTHPVFKGLDDYPRRQGVEKENSENHRVEFSVADDTQQRKKQATCAPSLSRISSVGKGPVRVTATPTVERKTTQMTPRALATPGQTPGNRLKTKSRIF